MEKKKKILVVDDEKEIINICKRLLNKMNIDILSAKDGMEALSIIRAQGQELSCILSDICMPKLDGIELIKLTRKINTKIPFIFFTGYANQKNIKLALEYGAFDLIAKPSLEGLLEAIDNALNINSNHDDILEELKTLTQKINLP